MALRLYGVIDENTTVEYMIRARSDDAAQATVALLQTQLTNMTFPLVAANFGEPVRLEGTLVSSRFTIKGPVNGASS